MAKANFPSSPSNGDTFTVGSIQYTYDSTKVVWNAVSTVANTINDIGNVNAPSPTNNQILKFSNSTSKFELADLQSSVAFNVNGLTDVSAASPSDGQILKYNSSASQYELADGASITAVTAMSDLAALPNPKAGDTVLVTSLNKMFIYSYAAPVTFVVTVVNVSGSNVFAIDGVNNAALTLNRGMTYIFDVSDSSNATHPLGFKTVTNFGTASEAESVTTAGVVVSGTAGSSGATVTYTVPNDASTNLKYYCQTHGNAMGANIVTSSSSGRGWFVIATVTNASPTSISGVDATYTFAQDGTPTVITAVSSDPEGLPITWNYAVTSGSLGSIATISQSDNVFTITPSTLEANAGTFSLTFSATDNINGAVSASSAFTLAFISWAVPTLSQEIATSNTSGAYRPFFGGGTDISNEGTAVIGHRQGFTNGYGGIRIVKLSGSTWSVEQDIENYIDSSLNSNYQYYLGDCVSISNDGNTVVASNTSNGNLNYVYTRSGSTWSFQQVIGNDSSTYNTQLEHMNINAISGDGNTIALGSNPRGSNSGTTVDKVYVYKRTGTTWAAETISVPTEVSNQGGGAAFGRWVSLSSDGNKLATGSSGLDVGATNAGGAWIANRSGSTWSWESKIHFGTPASNANCGFGQLGNMSSDGNYLLAGNLGANQEAYVFYWDGSSWNLQATISGTNPSTYTETLGPGGAGSFDSSGSVLALQGRQQAAWSTNMVGTFQADIIIYKRTGTSWSYLGYIRTPLSSDFFGFNSSCATLSRNSEYMIFGNPEAPDQNGNTGGRAYIYKRGS